MSTFSKIIFFHASLLTLLLLGSCSAKKQEQDESKVQRHIGLIEYDPKIDTLGFEVCHEDLMYPYFHHHDLSFSGEKSALVEQYRSQYNPVETKESGYITIRFVVNCNGETGRFRLIAMDNDYNVKSFSDDLSMQLFNITQSLKGWDVLKIDNVAYDYVRYLTFKIRNSEIIEILP